MSAGRSVAGSVDAALGVVIRLLLVAVFTLGGAWAAEVVRGRAVAGAAAGFAVIAAALLREKALAAFWARHRAALTLAGFFIYVAALAAATWSELFDLGWFDRLPF
jgi:hypothetical protein